MMSAETMSAPRYAAIDAVKGVGILLVAIGHTFPGTPYLATMSFSMPLFFFVSGYLFKEGHAPRRYFIDKAISLMLPYAIFTAIIYTAQYFYLGDWRANPADSAFRHLRAYAKPLILGAQLLRGWCAVSWFVPVLFMTQQLANLLIGRLSRPSIPLWCGFCVLLAYVNAARFPHFWLPLDAQVVLMALPIFYCGYWYRRHENMATSLLAACGTATAVVLLAHRVPIAYDMKASVYGVPGVSLFTALSMTVCLIRFCRWAIRWKGFAATFVALGGASLVIMFLHEPIQLYLLYDLHVASGTIRLLICMTASYTAFLVIERVSILRAFLLGSKADLLRITHWRSVVMQATR